MMSSAKSTSGIFVSYRRADSAGWAGRLVADLGRRVSPDSIFIHVSTIDVGHDFVAAIESALSSCRVVLVVIGPYWLAPAADGGEPRLFEDDDVVHLEISRALALPGVQVIPVLVGDAPLPGADELPEDLAPLSRRQAFELSDSRWDHDVDRLVRVLSKAGAGAARQAWLKPRYVYPAIASAIVFAALLAWNDRRERPAPSANETTDASVAAIPHETVETSSSNAPAAQSVQSGKPPGKTKQGAGVPAATKPQVAVTIQGAWAGEFVSGRSNRRSREMFTFEVEGAAVHGQNWLETWEEGASRPRVFRKFPLLGGKIDGDVVSFCIELADEWASGVEKYRQCFTGKIRKDEIAFRATNYIDHPRHVPEQETFVARRVEKSPETAAESSTRSPR